MSTQLRIDSSQGGTCSLLLDVNRLLTGDRLRTILDEGQDEDAKRDTDLGGETDPKIVASRLLSLRSICRSESSFRMAHMNLTGVSSPFRKIGFGQCGRVFEKVGRGCVIKVARHNFEDSLKNDLLCHMSICNAFKRHRCECQIPDVYKYVSKEDALWWSENQSLFEDDGNQEGFSLPQVALMTQKILSLPKSARHALIDLYCPPNLREAAKMSPINKDCVARVYLGRRSNMRALNAPNFTLRNFNLHLDQMLIHDLPVRRFASIMGEALATVHWAANVDGHDCEFVLGSEGYTTYRDDNIPIAGIPQDVAKSLPRNTKFTTEIEVDFTRRETRLWLIDFNLCNKFELAEVLQAGQADILVEHLVDAFFENDPYYPRPSFQTGSIDGELWEWFTTSYLERAERVLRDKEWGDLPRKFIEACIKRSHSV